MKDRTVETIAFTLVAAAIGTAPEVHANTTENNDFSPVSQENPSNTSVSIEEFTVLYDTFRVDESTFSRLSSIGQQVSREQFIVEVGVNNALFVIDALDASAEIAMEVGIDENDLSQLIELGVSESGMGIIIPTLRLNKDVEINGVLYRSNSLIIPIDYGDTRGIIPFMDVDGEGGEYAVGFYILENSRNIQALPVGLSFSGSETKPVSMLKMNQQTGEAEIVPTAEATINTTSSTVNFRALENPDSVIASLQPQSSVLVIGTEQLSVPGRNGAFRVAINNGQWGLISEPLLNISNSEVRFSTPAPFITSAEMEQEETANDEDTSLDPPPPTITPLVVAMAPAISPAELAIPPYIENTTPETIRTIATYNPDILAYEIIDSNGERLRYRSGMGSQPEQGILKERGRFCGDNWCLVIEMNDLHPQGTVSFAEELFAGNNTQTFATLYEEKYPILKTGGNFYLLYSDQYIGNRVPQGLNVQIKVNDMRAYSVQSIGNDYFIRGAYGSEYEIRYGIYNILNTALLDISYGYSLQGISVPQDSIATFMNEVSYNLEENLGTNNGYVWPIVNTSSST